MNEKHIMILGVGNILFTDEGLGIRIIEKLVDKYDFPENVSIQDGGVLGMNLLGIISETDYLIVVDAIKNKGTPGTLYRLEGDEIPKRILAKNSLHQVDLLEALTLCQALDKVPETVILGIEPKDIKTTGIELTAPIQERIDALIDMVLTELDGLGARVRLKGGNYLSCAQQFQQKIIEIKDEIGTIDMDGVKKKVSLILLEDPQIGEYIIVHAGFGINKIDETAAKETLKILRQISTMMDETSSLDHSQSIVKWTCVVNGISLDSPPANKTEAKKVDVRGIVQGVGFRPFVYQIAGLHGLSGDVANNSAGVIIHIEGNIKSINAFIQDLKTKCPPLARVTKISQTAIPLQGFKQFIIRKSKAGKSKSTLISPDMSICSDCLAELLDPNDRRYRYPFINCTNCGPRYTIIEDIPYDRPSTSMKHFIMCPLCQAEYDNPADRRFHAQPNACPVCGPHVMLYTASGSRVSTKRPVASTIRLLKKGMIVAIKGLGGFHLAADAEDDDAITRLRTRKHREEKPFAVMSYDMDRIRRYACVEPEEEALLRSPQRPIVILKKRKLNLLSKEISPGNRYFGAMLPYTPLHYLILAQDFTALVMTSGNISEEPIAIDNEDAFERLSSIADYFLVHNRDINLRTDDSIIKKTYGTSMFLRRSRGYVPRPVFLNKKVPGILACGAELKNTICLTRENNAFLSQHIGNLENLATYEFFKLTINHMKQILGIDPVIIAYDLHPNYLSTRYAEEQQDTEKIQVQHHHAHIVSCMAENKLDMPVIGLSFDGTGYGTDGNIWGGEILIADASRFTRAAHLSYIPMPGSSAAIKEPWRMAVSYLYNTYGDRFRDLELPLFKKIDEKNLEIVINMIGKEINSPYTSSLGRFFDGIAAIIGIRNSVFFEGQAAMELEMLAEGKIKETYDYEWVSRDCHQVLIQPIIYGVVKDMEKGIHPSVISTKFHMTLIRLFSELCAVIRKENKVNQVVLSGGVFQNSILLTGLIQALEKKDFQVFTHSRVPPNDGGICLGQAMVAAAKLET